MRLCLKGFVCHLFVFVYCRLDEAADTMKREIDYYNRVESQGLVNKLVLGLVLIHLHRGDYVAADQAFKSCLNR